MKCIRRILSGILSLAMVSSLAMAALPGASAAAESAGARVEQRTGELTVEISFDLPQTVAEVARRAVTLELTAAAGRLVLPLAQGESRENTLGIRAAVSKRNTAGEELVNEEQLGAYRAVLSGLRTGVEYTLILTGQGYGTYRTQVTLDGYNKHLLVRTGDATFPLGDVNRDGQGDGRVDQDDLVAMAAQLGQAGSAEVYDLNGDGRVDVTDLSYVNLVKGASGVAEVRETAAILQATVETAALAVESGSVEDLFAGESAVKLAPAAERGALEIPIALADSTEMREIAITSPDVSGAVESGAVVLELADGTTLERAFGQERPAGVHATGRTAGQSVITVDLGKKVAVKKVTVRVDTVAGQTGGSPEYAVVTQIEFLKDIVPADTQNDVNQVKALLAQAGDKRVELVWNPVRNITGYTVRYGTSEHALDRSMAVNTNRAVVSGLENQTTYYFQVTATNGGWSGKASELVSAMPVASSAPGAPSNIRVTAADQALRLSWGKTKDATFYQLYYRLRGTTAFTRFGGNLTGTSAVITGLTNGRTYEIAVRAGNAAGVGPNSALALGTPEPEIIEMPDLPEDGRIPNSQITSAVLANANNVDPQLCPGFRSSYLLDSDPGTYWVAKSWWLSSQITYTLAQPQDMNYLLLVPYLGGGHKNAIRTYHVAIWDEEGNVLLPNTAYPARGVNQEGYMVLTFPAVKGAKKVAVSLDEWEGNGCRVSVSEVAFYRSDSLPDDIAALFTDRTFTALREGVTREQIQALSARLEAKADFYLELARLRDELSLAQSLLENDRTALGLVRENFQSRSGGQDSGCGQSASALQPLGISARAGASVAIYAELPEDAAVSVVPTQFFGESGVWSGGAIQLVSGRNYITVPQIGSLADERGGCLYLTYAGAHPEQIKLQVRGDADVFLIPTLELSNWYELDEAGRRSVIGTYAEELQLYVAGLRNSGNLQTDIRNATEIATPSVLLSLPADQVLKGARGITNTSVEAMTEVLYQNVLAWEDELFVANKVQGIIPSELAREDYRYPMATRQNIRYMRMFAGAFMYAAGNHVGIGYGSSAGMACGRPVAVTGEGSANALFGWGIAHEIGHNMDKLGKAEITNNIYSLAVQAYDGAAMALNTRLTFSDVWTRIYAKVAAGRPGPANDVFTQLGMYWQLHLAYDEAAEPLAFYNAFFRLWKSGAYRDNTYDERVALIASQVAGRDLTEFFTRWGMELSGAVKERLSGYPAEPRAIWYLNDASRSYRLAGGGAETALAAVSAQVTDSKVTLTMTGGSALLGYEIRRNGTPVGFTTGSSYVDELGAANNLTYTYSVLPVDLLGNRGQEVSAQEVRVAHDVVIDPASYTAVRSGDTLRITMKNGAAQVTGIKVTSSGEMSGSYTVRVKADSRAAAWTVALSGEALSGQESTAYFRKPGAEAEDTRLWTYDAAVMEIVGLPAGAEVSLLDYPGDRIDFYEHAAVGLLKEDYRYGEGAEDKIAAGTLVILGTYRGDPVYNTVEIQAYYNTTGEAMEESETTTTAPRAMNGYGLLFAELPADGAVSDTSDGFFLFVPDLDAEQVLNSSQGVTDAYPLAIRAVFYRTDDPESSASRRVTSETLWIGFPDGEALPRIELVSTGR